MSSLEALETAALLAEEMQALAASLAYECCEMSITSHCAVAAHDGALNYYDTRSADLDVADYVIYLQWRGLLDVHPTVPSWVAVRDESEPLAAGEASA